MPIEAVVIAVLSGAIIGAISVLFLHYQRETITDHVPMKIKYFDDIEPITKTDTGDWIDLRAAEDVSFVAGEYKAIPLGVAIQLPAGYEALIAPRSSTYKNYGLIQVNSPAVIDESYCGDQDEIHFLALAMRDTEVKKNERICQLRIIKHQPEIVLDVVDHLGNQNRGGIGSTGRM